MTTKPEPTLDDLKWAIAKAERASCGWTTQSSHIYDRCWCAEADCPCHSLSFIEVHGRVPRFPELRAECPGADVFYLACHSGHLVRMTETGWLPFKSPHDVCHGLGYTARWHTPEDALLWIQVLNQAVGEPFQREIIKDNWLGAFQAAIEALGIEVGQGE